MAVDGCSFLLACCSAGQAFIAIVPARRQHEDGLLFQPGSFPKLGYPNIDLNILYSLQGPQIGAPHFQETPQLLSLGEQKM